jgi:nucleotide-binding universal stress UspA family protein
MTAPIIVGVADTVTARRAAATAAELARALGAPLHLVTSAGRHGQGLVGASTEKFMVDPVTVADQFLAALAGELGVPGTTYRVSTDDPASSLVAEATRLNARMIVVGNRRVQGLARVLGAVAVDVARQAPCDVFIANTTVDA